MAYSLKLIKMTEMPSFLHLLKDKISHYKNGLLCSHEISLVSLNILLTFESFVILEGDVLIQT